MLWRTWENVTLLPKFFKCAPQQAFFNEAALDFPPTYRYHKGVTSALSALTYRFCVLMCLTLGMQGVTPRSHAACVPPLPLAAAALCP